MMTEKELFYVVWTTRPHVCEICWMPVMEPQTFCFAHKVPKGMFKEFKYMPENIMLVCSIKCHWEVDKLYQWILRSNHILTLANHLQRKGL